MFTKRVRPAALWWALLVAAVVVGLSLGLYFLLRPGFSCGPEPPREWGEFSSAAVATNGPQCAAIGSSVLRRGGSAVDAAVAALFCEGVVCPQSMGVGGGFLMTVYRRSDRSAHTLVARETAPAAAHEDMFDGNSTLSQYGGLAAAVPGELLGYWEAVQRFGSGRVPWRDLVLPTVRLCEDGVPVTAYLARTLRGSRDRILSSPTLRDILVRPDGDLLHEGDLMRRPQLARTLRRIADEGVGAFYNGSLGEAFVRDVQELGGVLTMDDLRGYRAVWAEPVTAKLSGNLTLFSTPLPGSGPLLAFMLNILDTFVPAAADSVTWQRVAEAFKFGYGRRTELGDPDFVDISALLTNLTSRAYAEGVRAQIWDNRTWDDPAHYGSVLAQPDDHGTAHLSVLAPDGDAVSVTSTVNLILGAKVRSLSTGIIVNNEMDDFSAPNITNAFGVPPSPNNFIAPGKRPLSSMCPSVVVDARGDVRLVAGAAGGTKITTATALTVLNTLWRGLPVRKAVSALRLHHQLYPMQLDYERGFSQETLAALRLFGHNLTETEVGGSSVTAISVERGPAGGGDGGDACDERLPVQATVDMRRGGAVAGF